MAYIGNTSTTQAFTPAIDYFSGNGSTTAFTLSRPVASSAQVQVVVNNVQQNPTDAFTVLNNTITFTGAPSSGTNNIYVQYTSPLNQVIAPSQGTVGAVQMSSDAPLGVSDKLNSSTGYFDIPVGTTAQRPASPGTGMIRYNASNSEPEFYNGTTWKAFAQQASGIYSIEYIVVGGGAGGGSGGTGVGAQPNGGAGGGGGVVSGTLSVTPSTAYSLVVGGGGGVSTNGTASTGFTYTAGGGVTQSGRSGGASGTPQSFGGGSFVVYAGGGGGGAGGAGGNASGSYVGGNGGVGLLVSGFTGFGQSGYFGGGGGGGQSSGGGVGGTGGGGSSNNGVGTANTGGGGAGGYGSPGGGGAGGSGVVIIRYEGSQRGTGGTVSSSGGYTYHLFTTSGTFTS